MLLACVRRTHPHSWLATFKDRAFSLRSLCAHRLLTLWVFQQAFRRYPALRERFNSVVVNFKTAMTPTTKLVSDMVAMQACYVNMTHPDFLNGHKVRLLPSLCSFFNPFQGYGTRLRTA
jgi:hypothetical protein